MRQMLLIVATLLIAIMAAGQQSQPAPPSVASADVPLYPPLARAARVQGAVHVKVTTDGHKVVATHVEDGHKLLAAAAEANVKTWEFSTHDPTTFTVTFTYKIVSDLKGNPYGPTVLLRLPTQVEVLTRPLEISDPSPDPRGSVQKSGSTLLHEAQHAGGAEK